MMCKTTVKQAAAFLGVSDQFIRLGLQQGTLPIGSAVKMSTRWTYHISKNLLEQYAGVKMPSAATDGKTAVE